MISPIVFYLFRYYEESVSKSETDKERDERLERENFCQELFFSFISPELENARPDDSLRRPDSDKPEHRESADSIRRNLETLDLGAAPRTSEDAPCGDATGQAAAGSSKGIVVSKECDGCWL